MACEALQQQVDALKSTIAADENRLATQHLTTQQREALQETINELGQEIKATTKALEDCQKRWPRPLLVAPKSILDIQWTNPAPPPNQSVTHDWATSIVGGTGTFPEHAALEWIQVLHPDSEYDDVPVGATGWVVQPEESGVDFPFSHPFGGGDFEFWLAVDAAFRNLVAPGNSVDTTQSTRAGSLGLPTTLLGVEIDSSLVPPDIVDNLHEGDRVAVFGRWIVDSGHYYLSQDGGPDPGFRTEIHPPLLMAFSSTALRAASGGLPGTRLVVTSRPYLVGQTYTTDLNAIYQDGVADDGPFAAHIGKEIVKKATGQSQTVEAHPKIKSRPFRGTQLLRLIVRPPALPPLIAAKPHHLAVSFHFTVRTGCTIQVAFDGAAVNVFVAMNANTYNVPDRPERMDLFVSRDTLISENKEAGSAFDKADWISWLDPIAGSFDGVTTDEYSNDLVGDSVLTDAGAVRNVRADAIPGGQGITSSDMLPYPVTGWLEAQWQPDTPIVKPPITPVINPLQH